MLTKLQFTKRVAQNIKTIRLREGISQEELADRAQLYRTYVGHIEKGRYSPSGYVLYKLIKALNIDPKELLS